MANEGHVIDFEVNASDMWTPALQLDKGDSITISIKGTFTGTIKVRRWLVYYGSDYALVPSDNLGVIKEYTSEIEAVDISGGNYYYDIGTDEPIVGSAFVNLQ